MYPGIIFVVLGGIGPMLGGIIMSGLVGGPLIVSIDFLCWRRLYLEFRTERDSNSNDQYIYYVRRSKGMG